MFSSSPSTGDNGRHITWEKYEVDDAACLLLRYLKLLPEPIIPYNCYKKYTAMYEELVSAMNTNDGNDRAQLDAESRSRLLATVDLALEDTPEVNRYLLLYLLDFLQACVGHVSQNLMTPDRLIAVFQPSFLSLQPDKMSIQEHQIVHQVMVSMIDILDEGQLRRKLSIEGLEIRKGPPSDATARSPIAGHNSRAHQMSVALSLE